MKDRVNYRTVRKKPHLTHSSSLALNEEDGRKVCVDSVFNEYLIREVQRNPLIYDYGHENYTNAQMKQQVWEHIAEALMASVDAVKVRWKTLRDRYQRERRRLAVEEARGRLVHSPFALFPAMHFLDNFIGDAPKNARTKRVADLAPTNLAPIAPNSNKQRKDGCSLEGNMRSENQLNDSTFAIIQNKIGICDDQMAKVRDAENEHKKHASSDDCVPSTSFASALPEANVRQQLSTRQTPFTTVGTHSAAPLPFVVPLQQHIPPVEHVVIRSQYPSTQRTITMQRLQQDKTVQQVEQPGERVKMLQQTTEVAISSVETKADENIRLRTGRTLRKRKQSNQPITNEKLPSTVLLFHSNEVVTFGVPNYGSVTEDVLFAQSIGAKLAKIADGPEKDRLKMNILLCFINFCMS
uniref:MADF domain-containing protein n=1 Tax=Ascaris lumbricoides TaxID=6252 RepID=A0A0M3HRZ0_ASCLU